ncbi:protein fem-1 homolog B isoform X2 [Belonocnema kinseyi]|uniref:protein fem-1 homolog B isoform X2 n=1 Tax=Belonocnema kinseyi TaxID=2817044 RepID=UPI00143D5B4A|nr:protein fem-1 homolog B isoform X2 [Belonocnema kinseyi]
MTMTLQTDSTLEMAEKTDLSLSLMNRVYYAARDGMAITLFALLNEKTPEQINCLINQKVLQEDGQRCTPLIVASRFGHDRVVKMLLDKFKPELEEEGTVKFDGYVIEGASALWCAAGAGHLNVVKTLVKAGANVNHPTKTNSTPLRAACFDGRLDIVKYLTDHRANIHTANKYNNTCLMIAAYKGHLDVVSFLLENGANPNESAHCGATALHFASECGHCKIVSELLKHGTKMTKNVSGMTPLIAAAERTRRHVVECLVSREEVKKEETIEAYELLGASYANDKDNYCLSWAYSYLKKGMQLRYSDPENIIYKKRSEPVPAYENWRECENLAQLASIKNDQNALHMESLVIRERILGIHNPEVPHPIIYRGAVFADAARFDRCIDLWLRALKLRQLNNISVVKDLLRFAQVFSQMIHVGVHLQFTQVLSVLEASVIEIERNKTKIHHPEPKDDVDQFIDEMESNITTTLYILTILTKLITLNEKGDKADLGKAHYLVHKLCALQAALRDGQTLLHLAVNAETPVDDFHTNDVCKFPCAATAKLLVQCGADVNAMDNERNTPLHVIVSYEKPISDFMTLHAIIMGLIEAGAHMDTVNSQGKTPYEAATTGVAEIILRTQTKLSLKCMAAKAVKTYNLSYCGSVPQSLESFIELHGSGLNQG